MNEVDRDKLQRLYDAAMHGAHERDTEGDPFRAVLFAERAVLITHIVRECTDDTYTAVWTQQERKAQALRAELMDNAATDKAADAVAAVLVARG